MRTATVVTTAPSTLLILEVSDFREFMAHHPNLAAAIEIEAARRANAAKPDAGERSQTPQLADNRGNDYEYYE